MPREHSVLDWAADRKCVENMHLTMGPALVLPQSARIPEHLFFMRRSKESARHHRTRYNNIRRPMRPHTDPECEIISFLSSFFFLFVFHRRSHCLRTARERFTHYEIEFASILQRKISDGGHSPFILIGSQIKILFWCVADIRPQLRQWHSTWMNAKSRRESHTFVSSTSRSVE